MAEPDQKVVFELTESGDLYSTGIGLIYIFNLIVGTGALTMPAAFQSAGWLLSMVTVIVLGLFSYITVTFMNEAMGITNAVLTTERSEASGEHQGLKEQSVSESSPLLQEGSQNVFEIIRKVEMGKMAEMFFNKAGVTLFNLCIIIYLYGDLSIYAVAVPKSLRDVVCTYTYPNITNQTMGDGDPCWSSVSLTRENAYRVFVAVFFFTLGPFVFFNAQKTKYMQIATTIARWLGFSLMIVLAVIQLSGRGGGQGRPSVANIAGVPNLFGVCVYSFMCHHSLPSLVTPIRNKARLSLALAGDYLLILAFYSTISFTAIFTFSSVEDLYTLNFQPNEQGRQVVTHIKAFEYFLALFPVFMLSTSFPIIAVTLRNNLQNLLARPRFSRFVNHYLIALLSIVPPVIVAVITNRVDFLVGFTGSYAGVGIQYVIPACLVWLARRRVSELEAKGDCAQLHRSPFSHKAWVYVVLVWAFVCVAFVTVNHIIVGG